MAVQIDYVAAIETPGWCVSSLVPGSRTSWMLHVGTNDISWKRKDVLQYEYRELGKKLKSRTFCVVISILFLVQCTSEGRNRKVGGDDCVADEFEQGAGI